MNRIIEFFERLKSDFKIKKRQINRLIFFQHYLPEGNAHECSKPL
jgi:hypothetical protein